MNKKGWILRGFWFIVMGSTPGWVFAQNAIDIGGFIGGSYYLGDLNNGQQFYNTHLAYGGFLRYNLNSRWALRASLFGGNLSASDSDFGFEYQQLRNYDFSTPIVDITGQIEFNFMPFKPADDRKRFTPYVFTGGTFLIASYARNPYQPAIPMGVGFRYNISKKVGIGAEWGFRKTFTDYIDNVSWYEDIYSALANEGVYVKQRGYFHQKDWYSFAGVFLSFRIHTSSGDCNAYN